MDAKPNMIKKYNKPVIGLVLGIILPVISFLSYYFYMSLKSAEPLSLSRFIETLRDNEAFTAVFSICVLPNLLLFFLYKKLDYWYAIKGVILSVMIYTLLVVVLKFA
jgi:hypothetical protein